MTFPATLRDLTQEQFRKLYLQTTESEWEETSTERLAECSREVERRGLKQNLLDQIGELTLPHERWLQKKVLEATESIRSSSTTSTSENAADLSSEEMRQEIDSAWADLKETLRPLKPLWDLVSQQGTSMEDVAASLAPPVADHNETAQPSSEASSGARTSADANYGIVAYQRLPLQGKRDAFAPGDGFLYVRNDVLKEWVRRLTAGRCCPLQRKGVVGHSSDCWLRDAVR